MALEINYIILGIVGDTQAKWKIKKNIEGVTWESKNTKQKKKKGNKDNEKARTSSGIRATRYPAGVPFMFSWCDQDQVKHKGPFYLNVWHTMDGGERTSSNHHSSLKAFHHKGTRKNCG